MKEINSELPPSGYEIWVGIHFPIVSGAMVGKQKGKPGECEELFAGEHASEARLVMCD